MMSHIQTVKDKEDGSEVKIGVSVFVIQLRMWPNNWAPWLEVFQPLLLFSSPEVIVAPDVHLHLYPASQAYI